MVQTSEAVTWTLWGVGGVLGVVALGLLLWALFLDRARGRLRCPKCWYTLDAHTAQRCPECGFTPRHVKQLKRTRRRYYLAFAACLLGMFAYVTAVTPEMLRGGWRRGIPTTVLVTVWPIPLDTWLDVHLELATSNDPEIAELDRRIKEEELTEWQYSLWVWRLERHLRGQGRLGIHLEEPVIAKLEGARVNWTFNAETMDNVLAELSKRLDVPIRPDWASLIPEGIGPTRLVSGRFVHESGPDLLTRVMRNAGVGISIAPGWYVKDGEVVIGVYDAAAKDVACVVYDLGPLVEGRDELWRESVDEWMSHEERLARVHIMVTAGTFPEDWIDGWGDRAHAARLGTRWLVRAPARHHARIRALLDALQASLHSPGRVVAVDLLAWGEAAKAQEMLAGHVMQLNGAAISVEMLLADVEAACGLQVDADWEALASLNVRPAFQVETPRAAMTGEQLLTHALDWLVPESFNRVSWTLHHGVLRVGTTDQAVERTCVRVYNVMDLLQEPEWPVPGSDEFARSPVHLSPPEPWLLEQVEELRRAIESSVDPESWVNGGGEVGWVLHFGPCLVIQTTPRNHFRIEALLKVLREGPPERGRSTPAPAGEDIDLEKSGEGEAGDAEEAGEDTNNSRS